jgi:hypothetical protein
VLNLAIVQPDTLYLRPILPLPALDHIRFLFAFGGFQPDASAAAISAMNSTLILLILSVQFFVSSRIVFDARDLCIVKWKYFGTTDFDLLRYFRR